MDVPRLTAYILPLSGKEVLEDVEEILQNVVLVRTVIVVQRHCGHHVGFHLRSSLFQHFGYPNEG